MSESSKREHAPSLSHYDVVIVGAGLAGCATARALARADQTRQRKILLVDLHHGVSPRFSGEFIHPRGAQVLDDLGFYRPLVDAGAVDVDGFVVYEHAEARALALDYASLPNQRPRGLSVHHKTLVRVMRKELARDPQVELCEGWRVVGFEREPDGRITAVQIQTKTGDTQPVGCDLVVGADGKASPCRKLIGIPDARETLGFTAGISIHDADLAARLHANVFLGATGPTLCYPIAREEDGRLLFRLTFDLPHALPAKGPKLGQFLLQAFVPYLPGTLATQVAAEIRRKKGALELAPTVNLPAPPATLKNFALVGDAAGCSHPITASGMTMGLLDAYYLGEEARRRTPSDGQSWLNARSLRRYRSEHDRYVPTRQALADAIYEAFRGEGEGARSIRRALFRYWGASPQNRQRSLALLACAERRPQIFLSEYLKTARHALGTSVIPQHAEHFPYADRLRQVQGTLDLANSKLGLVAEVAWAQVRPSWFQLSR